MKTWVLLLLFSAAHAWGAAPDSLAGKVFHETVFATSVRYSWSRITELNPDGSIDVIKSAEGYALNLQAPFDFFLTTPPNGRTFSYLKTGANTATLIFTDALRGSDSYSLSFSSDNAGAIIDGRHTPAGGTPDDSFDLGVRPGGSATFNLTDSATLSRQYISNISVRGRVAPGQALIAGFIVPGSEMRDVLVRVVGPSLAKFGVTGAWADPDFDIFQGSGRAVRRDIHYKDWSSPAPYQYSSVTNPTAAFKKLFAVTGAFELLENSADAAEVTRLAPGAYSVVASAAAGNPGGEALIEIYLLP
ncbi:MAG: hypothetical protein ABIZ49_01450 [Opitutaceae bacterium]